MKLNKFFLLGLASLAFAACSSDEDESGNNLSGNGIVEVSIVAPQGRALVDATPGNAESTVNVTGEIIVKLTAVNGDKTATVTADGKGHMVKFFDVQGPKKIEAWINGGDTNGQGTTGIGEAAMQVKPESIPAYGSSTEFKLTGKTETNDGKKYEMYSAAVTMSIPVARLEISGIQHKHSEEAKGCKFKELTIDGIYLDKVATTATGNAVDYSWPAVKDGAQLPILKDEILAPNNNFLQTDAVWPAKNNEKAQAYAYNFYPNSKQMPIVKIYFAKATASDDNNPVSQPRYAVIKSYNNDAKFKFEAGKIYRITNVDLDDKNIIGDEEGNTLYGVNVTVTEAKWTVVDLTGQWEEQ